MSRLSISSLLLLVAAFSLGCASTQDAKTPDAETPDAEAEGVESTAPVAVAEEAPAEDAPAAGTISGEAEVAPGVTVTGQPTREQLEAAAGRGFKVVINLRGPDEPDVLADEKQIVEGAGMTYVQWDAGKGPASLTEENAKKLSEALAGEGPMIVHCGSGNRAAALVALKAAIVDGKTEAEATAMMEKAGKTKLLAQVKEAIAASAAK